MIVLEDVWVNLGDFQLRGITLSVDRGEYFIVMGPSGAGKTILLKTILGIYRPWRGRVVIDGVDVTNYPPERRGLSYVPQNYGLFPHMTVEDNIAFGLKIRGYSKHEIKRRVREIADVLGISHLLHRKPKTLSGGEQQRVALARALVVEPKAILLDEPLSALDYRTRRELQVFLRNLHTRLRFTAIHVTHDFTEAIMLGSRVAFMISGEVVQCSSVKELVLSPRRRDLAELLGLVNVLEGKVIACEGDTALIDVSGVVIRAKTLYNVVTGTRVLLVINPSDVEILESRVTSPVNVVSCRVEDIIWQVNYYEVTVKTDNLVMRVYIPNRQFERLGIRRGCTVYVKVPEDYIRVVPV